ncbi:RluA family pseudouridine synthase [Paenibacillus thiaminolyticus]|uniref:RluA family pseudouridine synthase n=1 Tax=Paenibacillus thiaminolyticus TaxID=49283 RepID=UPI00232F69F0|nr:RluA family pseudouridine synthase [Paenibacillus thiaminolyticus]WCF07044.1 RluA family pseudouridine synthase [Paenibacillus thiaminolyticus]
MTEPNGRKLAAELEYVVPEGDEGIQLRAVLRSRLNLSRRLLTRLKTMEAAITVNGLTERSGRPLSVRERLHAGDVVHVRIEEETVESIPPEPIPIDIVYEDDDVLVLNKPAGIVVHPTKGYPEGTLANGVVHYWRAKGELTRFRPANRLDQETSGLLIVAKHGHAHHQLADQMQTDDIWKGYEAFVYGVPSPQEGTIRAPIDRDKTEPHLRVVTEDGYDSITHYRVLETYGEEASLVSCRLETGRTHQIRVHMKHMGCPLLGDKFYGVGQAASPWLAGTLEPLTRHALHAAELRFKHPMTGEPMHFTAPLPDDLLALRERLLRGQQQ